MKLIAIILTSLAVASQASTDLSNGFLHFWMKDAVGPGKSSLSLELEYISDMIHSDSFYKDFKWQLSGPSIDAFYDVLAELDERDVDHVIHKTLNQQKKASYSIGADRGSIACFIDRGGNGQPVKAPVKACPLNLELMIFINQVS